MKIGCTTAADSSSLENTVQITTQSCAAENAPYDPFAVTPLTVNTPGPEKVSVRVWWCGKSLNSSLLAGVPFTT